MTWSPLSSRETGPHTGGHGHEIMNTGKADEFFKAFELPDNQGTVRWEVDISMGLGPTRMDI